MLKDYRKERAVAKWVRGKMEAARSVSNADAWHLIAYQHIQLTNPSIVLFTQPYLDITQL